ncbi:7288_t:CDS:10, partial [Entrophospora sp. SA101]
FVGLNNVKANDYVNVIIQALAHIPPLRDYFMLQNFENKSQLVQRFSTLVKKIWNPRAFKGQVSPHELLQEISNASNKRFKLAEQTDPLDFLSWFLNTLHKDLCGTKKSDSSIIYKIFQGEVKVESQFIITKDNTDEKNRQLFDVDRDLPPPPLFQDEVEKNIIPQVALSTVLQKYDGRTTLESAGALKRFQLISLPNYLIFHIKRFTKNNWDLEKNPTIVNFPIKNIDMKDFLENPESEMLDTHYDLIANICHEGKAGKSNGIYKVHVQHRGKEQWYQIQDLIVEEINAQMIFLSESYIQVRHLTFWRNGFSVEDGPLMAYDDPENQEFLKAIRSGQNQPVDVRVSRRLDEDYKPPPKKPTRPFSGSGQRLGSITPVVVSSQKFEVDESLPITSLQIRLADGTRMLARFNHTHTVNDIRNFINASRVGEAQRNYLLQTSFPVNDLNDGSQTLEEASLLNSVVIQRYT